MVVRVCVLGGGGGGSGRGGGTPSLNVAEDVAGGLKVTK